MFKKVLSSTVIVCFFLTTLGPYPQAHADTILSLPTPGTMVNLSPAYEPVIIKGLTVHKDNPFLFDFIVDVGQDRMSGEALKKESEKLIKYFLASLAIPDKDVWVNLSPYEKNRMIPEALGQTDMGRDLLEQDYILKQITASLIYPEKQLGKIFWDKVYAKAQEIYGTTQVPVNAFNKVWIMADRAEVFEHNQTAFVVDQHLKVMLEEDYLALKKHSASQKNDVILSLAKDHNKLKGSSASPQNDVRILSSQLIRQIVLPQLEKEVNTGKNFANLRQIFNSILLSSWYKRNLKAALLNQVYANKSKVKGINLNDPTVKQQIYEQYLKAYKKGVFNYIKEDITAGNGETIPRKYFSGGLAEGADAEDAFTTTTDPRVLDAAMGSSKENGMVQVEAGVKTTPTRGAPRARALRDAAMRSESGRFIFEGAQLTPSQREGLLENARQQGYKAIPSQSVTKQFNDWADEIGELMDLNPEAIGVLRQNAPVLAGQIDHLMEFLRSPPQDGQIQLNGETYTLNMFVHPTFKLLEAGPQGPPLAAFSVKDTDAKTLDIYARRLNGIVYELLRQVIFKDHAAELAAIGADSPEAQGFLAFMAQAIVRQEIYTGSDIPVAIPLEFLDEASGMTINQLQTMILELQYSLKPQVARLLKGQENSYAKSFIDVLLARLELLLLQRLEKAKEREYKRADTEVKKESLLKDITFLRRNSLKARLTLAGYRDGGLRKVESFHPSESFDTSYAGSKLFVPQIQAFGLAWGDYRVSNRPIYRIDETFGITNRDFLSQIGIFARHFMDPNLNVYDLGLRSVIFMIINHTVSLPKEKFEEAARRHLDKLSDDQRTRAAGAKTADERLDILKEAYGDIVSIAKAMGPEVLGDVKEVLVYSSTLKEGQEPISTPIQEKLFDFGLKRGTVSKCGNAVCASFGPAAKEATNILRDGKKGSVLVIIPEKYSDILDLNQRTSGGLFGDVAVAYKLGQPDPQVTINGLDLPIFPGASVTYGELSGFITTTHHDDRRGRFDMLRNTVLQFAENQVPVIVEEYLDRHGLTLEQIDYLVTHQPQRGGVMSLAKAFGIGTIVTITPDGQAVEDPTGYGKPGINTKIIWVGGELANGGGAATPSALRMILSARYKAGDKKGQLLVDPLHQTSFVTAAFGGGAQIAVNLAVAKPPGADWNPTQDEIERAKRGEVIDPIDSEGKIKTGTFVLRMAMTPDRPYASPLPKEIYEHKLLEILREFGQDINKVLPEAKALPMEKVLVLGAGQQGGPRIAELAKMKQVKKIYVYSRNKKSFDEMLEQIGKDYGDELKEYIIKIAEWVQSEAPGQEDKDYHLKKLLMDNKDIKLAFEILTEDKGIKEGRIQAIWETRLNVRIISNSSSLSVVKMAESVVEEIAKKRRLDPKQKRVQLGRILLMHDHTPFTNMFMEISDPRKRNIDERLYASAREFANQNRHVSVLADDTKPMAQVGNMAWFGGEFLAALSLWSRGYSPEVIRRAAATYEGPLLSPDLQVELPPLGADPFQTAAALVGVEVTDDILRNMEKALGLKLDERTMRAWDMYLAEFKKEKEKDKDLRRGIYESGVDEEGKIELLHREENGTLVPAKPGKPPSLTAATQRITDQLRQENNTPSTDEILNNPEELAKIRQELWLGRFAGAGRVLDADILTHERYILEFGKVRR